MGAAMPRGARGLAIALFAAIGLVSGTARAQNVTYGELKFGVIAHDVHFLEGKEAGVDLNPEIIFPSPVPDAWVDTAPVYLRWLLQPRPTIGGLINTAGFTNQYYVGPTWTWELVGNVLRPDDGITFGVFFGPGFNDGDIVAPTGSNRKSLGSHVLFRESLELGYRIDARWQISAYIDHVSNAGFARYNQSLNDVGGRIGLRF
jgi:lipid A 3-O-deacylase PagL